MLPAPALAPSCAAGMAISLAWGDGAGQLGSDDAKQDNPVVRTARKQRTTVSTAPSLRECPVAILARSGGRRSSSWQKSGYPRADVPGHVNQINGLQPPRDPGLIGARPIQARRSVVAITAGDFHRTPQVRPSPPRPPACAAAERRPRHSATPSTSGRSGCPVLRLRTDASPCTPAMPPIRLPQDAAYRRFTVLRLGSPRPKSGEARVRA